MSTQQNQYDFILDPNTTKPKGPAFLKDPFMRKIVLIIFILTVLIFVVVIGSLFIGSNGDSQDLRALSAQQTEILRITELGLESATGQEARQIAITTQSIIATDFAATTAYLKTLDVEVSPAEAASRLNKQSTERLTAAQQRNNYDQEFLSVLEQTIERYKTDLQKSLNTSSGQKKKNIVETAAQNVITLFPSERN